MNSFVRDFQTNEIIAEEVNDIKDFVQSRKTYLMENFSIFHCNIRSITKNFDQVITLLNSMQFPFDVIIFTETWNIPDLNFFALKDYHAYYNKGNVNQNDGVVAYVKDVYSGACSCDIHNIDNIKLLRLNLNVDRCRIVVDSLYRPPSTNIDEFNLNLSDFFKNYSYDKNKIYFFTGDINIDICSHKKYSQDYLNVLSEMGYKSLIGKYTRIQGGSKTCIDHIFVKSPDSRSFNSFVIQTDITDHFPIIAVMNQKVEQHINKNKKIFAINEKKLKDLIQREDWRDVYDSQDVDYCLDQMVNAIKNAVTKSTYSYTSKNIAKKRQPWVTLGIIQSIQRKQNTNTEISR